MLKIGFSNFLHSKVVYLSNCEKNGLLEQNKTCLKGGIKTIINWRV